MMGWLWIKEGFALFRKQPFGLITLFLSYFLVMLGLSFLPLVGQVLPIFLTPLFSVVFWEAGVCIEQNRHVSPVLLLTGLRHPMRGNLLKLGICYSLALVSVLMLANFFIDSNIQPMNFDKASTNVKEFSLEFGVKLLIFAILYCLPIVFFWYAAPLVIWQRMKVDKAIFFSFITVWKARKAFVVYGVAAMAILILNIALMSIIGNIIKINMYAFVFLMIFPTEIIITILYCSFYPSYVQIFGKPGELT